MAIVTKKLDSQAKGSLAQDEDWWRAHLDTDTGDIVVEHEWSYTTLRNLKTNDGTKRYSVKEFLGGDDPKGAQARKELRRLIDDGFGAKNAPRT